ncbi:MAG TPA: hypothetical protein VL171_13450 [Verrucomicrobiae bacterium]|nr:hypothetical protein [Verrucomicrobiae bacterium]
MNRLDLDMSISVDEGESLYSLQAVRLKRQLYHDWSVRPHVLSQYMPFFYLVPGVIARFWGTDWLGTLAVGRAYVYVLWLGVGLMAYALVRQSGGRRIVAAFAALLWFAGSLAPEYADSFRPDSAMVFFSFAGVFFYQRSEQRGNVMLAALLLATAFLHKQSAICAALAVGMDAFFQRRLKTLAVMLGTWTVGIGTVYCLAQVATSGAFEKNVWGSLLAWGGAQHVAIVLALAGLRGVAVFTGAGIATAAGVGPRLLRLYFIIAIVLAITSSAKFGSGANYYLEAYAVGCVLTGILSNEWLTGSTRHAVGFQIAWLGLATAACLTALGPRLVSARELAGEIRDRRQIHKQIAEDWDRLINHLKILGDPQLIEDVYLAVRSGTNPVLVNASMFASMRQSGRFDDGDIVRQIIAEGFKAIITTRPLNEAGGFRHFPDKWIELIRARYRLAERYELRAQNTTFYMYVPKPTGGETRAVRAD